MITSEVQRTLVKSPPELWAELSDPTALARHLGELGEIRITRTEPERTIEWEAGRTCGTVSIKPSGWGTRVTLSASRELDAPSEQPSPAPAQTTPEENLLAPPQDEDVSAHESESAEHDSAASAPVEPAQVEAESVETERLETKPPEAASYELPAPEASSPEGPLVESRRGFFARLFGWRKPAAPPRGERADAALGSWAHAEAGAERPHSAALRRLWIAPQQSDPHEPEPEPQRSETEWQPELQEPEPHQPELQEPELQEPEPQESEQPEPHQGEPHEERAAVGAHPAEQEPSAVDEPEGHVDIAAELRAAEEAQTAAVTAVLTAALDRLGAAHHRPFSRS
jgi:hypothetical protein